MQLFDGSTPTSCWIGWSLKAIWKTWNRPSSKKTCHCSTQPKTRPNCRSWLSWGKHVAWLVNHCLLQPLLIWFDNECFTKNIGCFCCCFQDWLYLCFQYDPPRIPSELRTWAGLRVLCRWHERSAGMRYNKTPLSLTSQIEILKKRGLQFGNEIQAEHYLSFP